MKLKTLLTEDVSSNDLHITAGEMISQVGLYTKKNAAKLKSSTNSNLYRFFDTPRQEAQLIKISEDYKKYLKKVQKAIDELTNDPMYQVAIGDAGGRVRDRGIGETLEKAYYRFNDI